jgi:hypothetical protein
VSYIENRFGVEVFLARLRSQLKDRSFRPVAVRERMIPKTGGKLRRLGIPPVADRSGTGVVEAGVGTRLGGGLSAVLLRVSPELTRS